MKSKWAKCYEKGMKSMGKSKKTDINLPKSMPPLTPEAQENQMISLAMDCAEKQMREGTASSAVIVHFLKLGTEKAELEREKLKHENDLLKAKTQSLESATHVEELMKEAIEAMKSYGGAV